MMGFLGIGNNPMVGCTVACAVASKELSSAIAELFSLLLLNPSLLRRQPLSGACRPLSSFGSGVPAASMFFEHLADADDAALMCLINTITSIGLPIHTFGDVSFFI